MKRFLRTSGRALRLLLPVAFLFAGCEKGKQAEEPVAAVPVEVLAVRSDSLSETSVLTGVLEAIRAVDVIGEMGGELMTLRRDVGDRVARDEILASVDKEVARENLRHAEAALLATEARHEIAANDFERDSTLLAGGDISRAAFESSRMARTTARADRMAARATRELAARDLRKTDVHAPIAGEISRRYADTGAYVSPGTPLFRIVDIDSLRLRLGVSQTDVARLRPDAAVRVTAEAMGMRSFSGRIRSIAPEADEATRTFSVEVILPNPPDRPLRDGVVVRAELTLDRRESVIAVPRETVFRRSGGAYLFVEKDGVAHGREVRAGPMIDGMIVIDEGLAPGERVIVVGMQNLRDGMPVRIEAEHDGRIIREESGS
ncbi:MAG: efflux RND transporter periplasmic adaptor subunit [Candidatus Eisenbacteria bacterium]|nr:efflux RND transporter periplasmic adaptor subunit [Candidatus Eisenbacteria bacterium]